MYHGGGGYTWWDVYNLPISTRRFVYNRLYEQLNPKKDNTEVVDQGRAIAERLRLEQGQQAPTYSTKMLQK